MDDPSAGDGPSPSVRRSAARAWSMPGQWLMALGGMLISGGFLLVCLAYLTVVIWNFSPVSIFLIPLLIGGLATSGWHIGATILSLLRPQLSSPMQVALMQPAWPVYLCIPIALWWLMHLSLGALLAISIMLEHPADLVIVILVTILSTIFTYAAHGFLMLVVTCFTKQADWIVRVWGWRRACTIGHGIAVLAVGVVRLLEG